MAPENPKATLRQLVAARDRMRQEASAAAAAHRELSTAETALMNAVAADYLTRVGIRVKASEFGLEAGTGQAAHDRQVEVQATQRAALEVLRPFESAARARFRCALQLLHVPQVQAKLKGAAAQKIEVERLLPALVRLGEAYEDVLDFRKDVVGLAALLGNAEGQEGNENFAYQVVTLTGRLREQMDELRRSVLDCPYPFEHAESGVTLARYAMEMLPPAEDIGGVFTTAQSVLEKLTQLYFRVLSRLTVTVEEVELAVGLPRLPDVQEQRESRSDA